MILLHLADRLPEKPGGDFADHLNYMALEITFVLPSLTEFKKALRLHHPCTAWGTYPKNLIAGSTNVGVGVLYYF
jgi:hypothetical protein